jgi:hypothetical protein
MEGLFGFDFSDVSEPTTVPAGEYHVRIVNAEEKTAKNGETKYLTVRLEILEGASVSPETLLAAKDLNHTVFLPKGTDTPKQRQNSLWRIKEFCLAFGIDPTNNMDLAEWRGLTAWAIIAEDEDKQYGMQNNVKKWIVAQG